MVRSSYGIGDQSNYCDDIIISCCCPCCVVNQLYQTTSSKGNPSTDGGARFNTHSMSAVGTGADFQRLLVTCLCFQCTVANNMNSTFGMPHVMGCCCTSFCLARNFIRYQFRLKPVTGDDCLEECGIPYAVYCCGSACANAIPCLWCILYGMFVLFNSQLSREVQSRLPLVDTRYLVGYQPPGTEEDPNHPNSSPVGPTVIRSSDIEMTHPMTVNMAEATVIHSPFYDQHGKTSTV